MPTVVEEVARRLDGSSVLGRSLGSQADLPRTMREGLPLTARKGLTQAGLTQQEIGSFVIPQRARRHRAGKNLRNSPSRRPPKRGAAVALADPCRYPTW